MGYLMLCWVSVRWSQQSYKSSAHRVAFSENQSSALGSASRCDQLETSAFVAAIDRIGGLLLMNLTKQKDCASDPKRLFAEQR
jgi:hypothetical protein